MFTCLKLALLLLAWAAALQPVAAADPKVLIVNSNASVPKFKQIEDSFAAAFASGISRLDLGSDSDVDARVRRAMLSQRPDIVFCVGSRAFIAAAAASQRTVLVFSSAINWRRLPLTERSFGVAGELPPAFQFASIRHLFKSLRKLGVLYSDQFNKETAAAAVEAGAEVGIEVLAQSVFRPSDLDEAARKLLPRVDALWVIPDPVVLSSDDSVTRLFARAREAKVPVFAYDDSFIEQGALLAIAPDQGTMGTQAAMIAEDVFSGQGMPRRVVDPAGSEIVLNLKLLPAYSLPLNKDALPSVNRLIK